MVVSALRAISAVAEFLVFIRAIIGESTSVKQGESGGEHDVNKLYAWESDSFTTYVTGDPLRSCIC